MNPLLSVIIPVYNEEKILEDCLSSLNKQTYKSLEVIVVDDGSTDQSIKVAEHANAKALKQNHKGPGTARNLGASKAKGEILVFVDADMTFDKDFLKDLTKPIIEKKAIGTFSKNEFVANEKDIWSICWNINRNLPPGRMIPIDYPDKAPVFRAILKSEFEKVQGFDLTGEYTDDWSLSRKLKIKSSLAPGAKYYHYNPSTLKEVYSQAIWIGKSKFISGSLLRRMKSLLLYNPLTSLLVGLVKSASSLNPNFFIFKMIYDFAVLKSVLFSATSKSKAK